ncbi:hypothetical protein V5799_006577 [Amblyomma americanum]|uniref:Deoxyribonuclease TATDN1 n=1 Tax=Amblyomma americanum TaxID=6943 RepID=A0AAQ4DW07_AMBAM
MASGNAGCDQLLGMEMKNESGDDENYILVDICANLVNKKFSRDLESVIQRATDAGVKKMVVLGTSAHTSKEALRLTRMHPGTVYCTAGIHPHDAKSWDDDTLEALRSVASSPECVGIGECGLDFSKNFSTPECQVEVLEKQLVRTNAAGRNETGWDQHPTYVAWTRPMRRLSQIAHSHQPRMSDSPGV